MKASLDRLRLWLQENPVNGSLEPSKWPIGVECLLEPWPPSPATPSSLPAVQSIWSLPYEGKGPLAQSTLFWGDRLSALCCWSYSAMQILKFHSRTVFVGDAASTALCDRLGLPYHEVSTSLVRLEGVDPRMWSAGKLAAFSGQKGPFIHLDWDVILFNSLPGRILSADFSCQCADPLWVKGDRLSYLYARTLLEVLQHQSLPRNISESLDVPFLLRSQNAYNFGIVGCSVPDTFSEWSRLILEALTENSSARSFNLLDNPSYSILVWEQMLLSYMVASFGGKFECLFKDDHCRSAAASLGYVHFISKSKHNPVAARMLRTSFSEAYPFQYEVCCRLDRDLPLNS